MTRKLQVLQNRVGMARLQVGAPMPKAGEQRMRGGNLQRRNDRFLRRYPLCRRCEELGFVEPAVQCDHVVPLWAGGVDDESNLQGLCIPCHDAKSKLEAAMRARGETPIAEPLQRPAPTFGIA